MCVASREGLKQACNEDGDEDDAVDDEGALPATDGPVRSVIEYVGEASKLLGSHIICWGGK